MQIILRHIIINTHASLFTIWEKLPKILDIVSCHFCLLCSLQEINKKKKRQKTKINMISGTIFQFLYTHTSNSHVGNEQQV